MFSSRVWPRVSAPSFIMVHYVYIVVLGLVGMVMIYPQKNISAIDALFQGMAAATMTGLNTVDFKGLSIFQQLVLYISPVLGNICFINFIVVLVRLYWFESKFKEIVRFSRLPSAERTHRVEHGLKTHKTIGLATAIEEPTVLLPEPVEAKEAEGLKHRNSHIPDEVLDEKEQDGSKPTVVEKQLPITGPGHVSFSTDTFKPREKALRIPGPREFEAGHRAHEVDEEADGDELTKATSIDPSLVGATSVRDRGKLERILSHAASVEQAASSAFVLGSASRPRSRSRSVSRSLRPLSRTGSRGSQAPYLSYTPTIGRNSQFLNLTEEQRIELGGIEYRSLKLLAKIVGGYYFGFLLLGSVLLIIWAYTADPSHRKYLLENGIHPVWWAFYSCMTTYNNLGFALTPDSMVNFRSSTFPMLFMTFLIIAGNTAYPCMLRLIIWCMFRISPKTSAIREPLNFLLDHPRRCYTLLFPSRATWMLLGTLVLLNGLDIMLFMILDLKNPEVTAIDTTWHRLCAAAFQSTASRTAGATTFALSKIHPAVQFSLMVMMYISVFPVAISMRNTNTYEESSLGLYESEEEVDENTNSSSYLGQHIKKQLAFDLWYIFLGVFLITIAEGDKIADLTDPAFQVFAIFFEVVSAYGNVGLSLGHPTINAGLSGKFTIVSKLVMCAMMVRGRHRGLPYELDRAIVLPGERHRREEQSRAGSQVVSNN
ncbi:potassium transporter 1 [Nannizzia gypsea CBS 118893]|uniref:Potassium transport protein n=1 Tax=Arthroderma gypseum (strain ATCC MYA-4604 / CBS 118893) TaxID=535722 RepID=E4UQ87_ARTGP|nr:potassium transporter 1 [Nannizzia gypsea CBS 118893]EFQ99168.1 potassium transporter 1 [Nannizzia gypsea CBS 118893]